MIFGPVSQAAADSLQELDSLARSAGCEVVDRVSVRRARPDAALCMGSGKAQELGERLAQTGAQCVIFDHALTPVQQRNLNRLWSLPVFDRTELILEIFAQRARSHEGKLQVELARIEHQLTRLVRGWTHLERQRGGIGQRGGPGEKQIELDRRMLDVKARQLRERIARLERQRRTRRRARMRSDVPAVSIVGYTNAGKSTLFNRLTGATTLAADQLFATLDTLTRRVRLATGQRIVLSDTVGFVRALPHELVDAFRATLEETVDADLLLHVIDASSPDRLEQAEEVRSVLASIGADRVPCIEVLNKCEQAGLSAAVRRGPCGSIDQVTLSALTGQGVEGLRQALGEFCDARAREAPELSEGPPRGLVPPDGSAIAPER